MPEQNEITYEAVDLGALVSLLWRNLWKLLILAAAAAVIVHTVTPNVTEKSFLAETDLYFGYTDSAENNPDMAVAVMSGAALIKTAEVLEPIGQRLGIPISVKDLASAITLKSEENSSVLHLSVTAGSFSGAKALAGAIAQSAEEKIGETMEYVYCRQLGEISVTQSINDTNIAKYSALAAILAVVLGAVVLVCLELFNRRIKDLDGAAAITGLPVLGVIPELRRDRMRKRCRPHPLNSPEAPFAYREAYKSLRTNLLHEAGKKGMKSFVVTGSLAEEDAGNTAANLALALAQTGKRTLIADFNLRAPGLEAYLGVSGEKGVRDILLGEAVFRDCVINTGEKNLFALLSGGCADNASELLSRAHAEELVRALSAGYDYVILTSPPAAAVTDAALLGAAADGVLLVTRSRYANAETVQLALQRLRAVGCDVFGLVLTRLDVRKMYSKNGYSQALKMSGSLE